MLDDFSIGDIFSILLKRWWIFLCSIVICGVVAFTYTNFFISCKYISTGLLYINNRANINQSGDTGANLNDMYVAERLVENYKVILKTDKFLNAIIKDTNYDMTQKQLSDMISVIGITDTEVLKISVVAYDPVKANRIAQSILVNAQEQLADVLDVGHVKIIENASFNQTPTSPNPKKNTLLGLVLGFIIAAAISFLLELSDVTIKSEEDIEKHYNIPIVGTIPDLHEIIIAPGNNQNNPAVTK